MEYTKNELADYYLSTKYDLGDYETQDFLTILTSKIYTYLAPEVSKVIFICLTRYKYLHTYYEKNGYIWRSDWRYEVRDKTTGKLEVFQYSMEEQLPFNVLDKGTYIDFFLHYIKVVNDEYFKEQQEEQTEYERYGKKSTYHYPLVIYKRNMHRITSLCYWYLGKKDTDTIVEEYTREFYLRLADTDFSEPQAEIDAYNVYVREDYRLLRGRTRLNKRNTIPEDCTIKT